ncbi:MAG: phosphate ABC transporter permease subunit PstC [Phycisphaerae bacterium]
MHAVLFACAMISILTTLGIIWVLCSESVTFFAKVSPVSFFTGTSWEPHSAPPRFGVLPLISGTLLVAGGALLVGVPVGLGTALFLSEYAPKSLRAIGKPILEILAGIPTVVYGYFALTFITPDVIQRIFPNADAFNAASAAIVVGIMIIPTIASLCDDAFRAVPRRMREGAYALAATRLEVSLRVVLPSALSGVLAACLLGLARAIGETMAVAMAAGVRPKLTLNPLESIQTMTSFMVTVQSGEAAQGTTAYRSLFAVGLTLFIITLAINLISQRVLRRFREVYE